MNRSLFELVRLKKFREHTPFPSVTHRIPLRFPSPIRGMHHGLRERPMANWSNEILKSIVVREGTFVGKLPNHPSYEFVKESYLPWRDQTSFLSKFMASLAASNMSTSPSLSMSAVGFHHTFPGRVSKAIARMEASTMSTSKSASMSP